MVSNIVQRKVSELISQATVENFILSLKEMMKNGLSWNDIENKSQSALIHKIYLVLNKVSVAQLGFLLSSMILLFKNQDLDKILSDSKINDDRKTAPKILFYQRINEAIHHCSQKICPLVMQDILNFYAFVSKYPYWQEYLAKGLPHLEGVIAKQCFPQSSLYEMKNILQPLIAIYRHYSNLPQEMQTHLLLNLQKIISSAKKFHAHNFVEVLIDLAKFSLAWRTISRELKNALLERMKTIFLESPAYRVIKAVWAMGVLELNWKVFGDMQNELSEIVKKKIIAHGLTLNGAYKLDAYMLIQLQEISLYFSWELPSELKKSIHQATKHLQVTQSQWEKWVIRELKKILSERGIHFNVEYLLCHFKHGDVVFPDKKIVLELNGDFHYDTQGRLRAKDYFIQKLLLEAGYRVINFSQKEWYEGLEKGMTPCQILSKLLYDNNLIFCKKVTPLRVKKERSVHKENSENPFSLLEDKVTTHASLDLVDHSLKTLISPKKSKPTLQPSSKAIKEEEVKSSNIFITKEVTVVKNYFFFKACQKSRKILLGSAIGAVGIHCALNQLMHEKGERNNLCLNLGMVFLIVGVSYLLTQEFKPLRPTL